MKSLSRVGLLATPWTAAYQAPPSMGFSRQEYWSGVPLPSLNGMHRWWNSFCLLKKKQKTLFIWFHISLRTLPHFLLPFHWTSLKICLFFFFFFKQRVILKIVSFYWFILAILQGMWNLSSLTRDWTQNPGSLKWKHRFPTTELPGKSQ